MCSYCIMSQGSLDTYVICSVIDTVYAGYISTLYIDRYSIDTVDLASPDTGWFGWSQRSTGWENAPLHPSCRAVPRSHNNTA